MESHWSWHLLSARGDSHVDMSIGSQRHWRLDIRDRASEIGEEIPRF